MQSTASLYPSQYREYYRDWKDAYAKKPEIFHDSGFEWLAKHAKKVGGSHKVVDGKIMRVFFPIYIEPTVPRNMQLVFSANGYRVVSDKEVVDTHNRQVSINKAFQQLAKKSGLDANVIKTNLNTYAEELGASGAMILVVSRHPYDIVGMSTGRAWKSCHTVGGMSPRDKKADEIARRKFYEKHEALRKAAEVEAAKSDEYVEANKNFSAARKRRAMAKSSVNSFTEDLNLKSDSVLEKDRAAIKKAATGKEREVLAAILSFWAKVLVRESIESEPAFAVPSWARPGAVGEDTRRKLLFDGDSSFCGGSQGFAQGKAELITGDFSNPVMLDLSRQEIPDFNSEDFADALLGIYLSSIRRKLALQTDLNLNRDQLVQAFQEKRIVVFIPALVDFVCPEPSAARDLLRKVSPFDVWRVIESTLKISLSLNEVVDKHVAGLATALRDAETEYLKADNRVVRAREKNPAQHAWDVAKTKTYDEEQDKYRTGVYSHLVRQDVVTGSVIAYVIKPKMSLLTSLERAGKLLPKFAEVLESRLDRGNKDPIFEPLGRVIFRTASSRYEDDGQSPIAYLRVGKVYGFASREKIESQFERMAKHLVVTLNKSARRDMAGSDVIPRALHRGDHDTTYAEGDLYGSPRLNYHED